MPNAGFTVPVGIQRRGRLSVWSPPPAMSTPGVHVLVTTRHGGVSSAPWDSMNLSPSTGDDREDVEANRDRLRRELAMPEPRWLHQVHGDVVVDATDLDGIPGGTLQADGLWTREADVALVVGVADCVPVFIWEARARALAVVHAGWRGTASGILGRAVDQLRRAGARPEDLRVALGPSIGGCCYEVGAEVSSRMPGEAVQARHDRHFIDLRAANRAQALDAGIASRHLHTQPPCTACHPDWFFSHRRLGPATGRMWAVGWLDG